VRRHLLVGCAALTLVGASAVAASSARGEDGGLVCFTLVGGTVCVPPDDPLVDYYGGHQGEQYPDLGTAPSGTQPPPTTLAPGTPVRCFTLVGGTFCYAEGTPEHARAEEAEAAYREGRPAPSAPTDTVIVVSPEPEPEPELETVPPVAWTDSADLTAAAPAPATAPTQAFTEPAPAPVATLPATR
jgi:hypothetical protein